MGEAYRLKVAREKAEAEGRKKERTEIVDYLLRLAEGLRSESDDALVTKQIETDDRAAVHAAAKVLDLAAEKINERGR